MRLLTLLALAILPAVASAGSPPQQSFFRQRTVFRGAAPAQSLPVLERQVIRERTFLPPPPVVEREVIRERTFTPSYAPALAPACAGGACLSPSQAAALRAAQLRALGY